RRDKGIEFALEHFPADLLQRDYTLVIAGYPQELSLEELRAIAELRGVAEHVELIPQFLTEDELRRQYAESTYVLYPYAPWYTGGRGPVKDAAGHGRPVLTSNAAGLADLVCGQGYGQVFHAGDADDFVLKVRAMDQGVR